MSSWANCFKARPTRQNNPRKALAIRSIEQKVAGNEPDAKAILPEQRSVKKQFPVRISNGNSTKARSAGGLNYVHTHSTRPMARFAGGGRPRTPIGVGRRGIMVQVPQLPFGKRGIFSGLVRVGSTSILGAKVGGSPSKVSQGVREERRKDGTENFKYADLPESQIGSPCRQRGRCQVEIVDIDER